MQHEDLILFCHITRRAIRRNPEGEATSQQADRRFHIYLEPGSRQVHFKATGVPETGIFADLDIVRFIDKHLEVNCFSIIRQLVTDDLPHLDLAKINGGTRFQRTAPFCLQYEMLPRLVSGDYRHRVQTDIVLYKLPAVNGVYGDIGSAQKSTQPGNGAGTDTRLDHPEAGLLCQIALGALVHLHRHPNMLEVIFKINLRHQANFDILVLDPGLAGHQSFGIFKADKDRRTNLGHCLVGHPRTDQCCNDGDNPDDGNTLARFNHGFGYLVFRCVTGNVICHLLTPYCPRFPGDQRSGQQ